MNTATRVAVYVAGLAVVFVGAMGVGDAVGPVRADPAPSASPGAEADHPAGHAADPGPGPTGAPAPVEQSAGLAVTQDGYRLELLDQGHAAGRAGELRLRLLGPDGAPVTRYELRHERELHLIVVSRDLADYQHLHPVRDAEGTWSVPFTPERGGGYKVFADFAAAGAARELTLATDLLVAGPGAPAPAAVPSAQVRTARVGEFEVALSGETAAGAASTLTFTVTRDGEPVTDLEPYLGALGHLVALRAGDLAYLHVHPVEQTGPDGPRIVFQAEVPSPGDYHLFLEFQHAGEVRLARFTTTAADGSSPTGSEAEEHAADEHGEAPAEGGHEH
ncbi:hypothetical protein [Allostreptomyces psammosilenae]|uniref:Secreted protein n=1 Tax=Allostreptomyces psammosilenae TaxID=1892865 RepID=A0A852ZSY7_9ACTN|nr:hypothetical protein [Allostreptomyces psammosilenae]NYI03924.1 hypothetical protein [Allostreptomyces psammosilenae]